MSTEKRLEAMSGQLLKKQLLLDDATCSKAALSARLRAANQAIQRLEASQQQAHLAYPVNTRSTVKGLIALFILDLSSYTFCLFFGPLHIKRGLFFKFLYMSLTRIHLLVSCAHTNRHFLPVLLFIFFK